MRVSIVINNYNYARFLRAAIDSALDQTYPECEVIVVDDGSTDESREVIATYGARVKSILKQNGGQASCLGAGFEASRGDVLIFLDSDDILFPRAAECAADALASPEVSKVHWPLTIVDAEGSATGQFYPLAELDDGDLRDAVIQRGVDGYSWPATSGNAWPRWFIERVFPLPEADFRFGPDRYLCMLAPLFGRIAKIDVPLAAYRMHGGNNHPYLRLEDPTGEEIRRWEHCSELLRRRFLADGVVVDVESWRRQSWYYQQLLATREIGETVPPDTTLVLVDEHDLPLSKSILGRRRLPFLERDGEEWGEPEDDAQAISELERMKREGAGFIVFTWPAFWWLEYYTGLREHLRLNSECVLQNDRLVIFDLRDRSATSGRSRHTVSVC